MSEDGDALDYDFREVRVAQTVMGLARQSILMADHSKFARSAPVRIGRIGNFDTFISDMRPPKAFAEVARDGKCEVVIAS